MVKQIVKAFRQTVECGATGLSLLTAYLAVSALCQKAQYETALSQAYRTWTGQSVQASPEPVVILGAHSVPWGIYLCQSVRRLDKVPNHCIPVSVIEVAFIRLLSPENQQICVQALVKSWASQHQPPNPQEVLDSLKDNGWEVEDVGGWSRSAADSYWINAIRQRGSTEPLPAWAQLNESAGVAKSQPKKSRSSSTSKPFGGSASDASSGGKRDHKDLYLE